MNYDVVIAGAGASGIMAAVTAAKYGANVCVIEEQPRAGRKILMTGNGKCNLTNLSMSASCYRSDSEKTVECDFAEFSSGKDGAIMNIIGRFDNKAVIDFFYTEGLLVRDRDGYVYPYGEQASSVLDILRLAMTRYGVTLLCGCKNIRITRRDGGKDRGFDIEADICEEEIRHMTCHAEKIIIATGSGAGLTKSEADSGYSMARQMGHHIVKPLPGLVPLTCAGKFFKELAGVRAKGSIRLNIGGRTVAREYGEIQFTDYGISGIPVFQISRYAVRAMAGGEKDVTALIDFIPEYDMAQLEKYIECLTQNKNAKGKAEKKTENGVNIKNMSNIENISYGEFLAGIVNKKVMNLVVKLSGGDIHRIVRLLKEFTVTVTGDRGFAAAQVCQGGVRLDEIDENTMESLMTPGLYFCGEILDVDGICGGYNLQWAWSSGHLAGESAVRTALADE